MASQITIKETYLAVNDLTKTVARHDQWLSATDNRLEHLGVTVERLRMEEVRDRLTRLETKVEHVEKRQDEEYGRLWDVAKLFLAAIVGGLVTLLVQYALRRVVK